MADDHVGVGFVECVEEVGQQCAFVGHGVYDAFGVLLGELFEFGGEALERADVGVHCAWKRLGRGRVIKVDWEMCQRRDDASGLKNLLLDQIRAEAQTISQLFSW